MEQEEKKPLEIIQDCLKGGRGVKLTRKSKGQQTILKPGFRLILRQKPAGSFLGEGVSTPKTKSMIYGETENGDSFSASLDFIIKAEEV